MRKLIPFLPVLILAICTYFVLRPPMTTREPSVPDLTGVKTSEKTTDQIARLNSESARYENMTSLKAEMDVTFKRDGTHRLTAEVYCERPHRYRLKISSVMGDEVDIGSNDHHFWYWFRRQDEGTVYFGVYEKAEFMDVPLNPTVLLQCFRIVPIDTSGGVVKRDGRTALVRKNGSYLRATVYAEDLSRVVGHYVYDADNQLSAFCDVISHLNVNNYELPGDVTLGFPRENIQMRWKVKRYEINPTIGNDMWVMPSRAKFHEVQ